MSLFDGLFKYKEAKLYDAAKSRKDSRLHTPYDYRETLVNNSVSRFILRNQTIRYFLIFLNDYLYNVTKGIRHLKSYKNYTVKKDDQNVR
jgi:hypothetical protein